MMYEDAKRWRDGVYFSGVITKRKLTSFAKRRNNPIINNRSEKES